MKNSLIPKKTIFRLSSIPILLITFYQTLIRPFMPPACRFTPTCSEYSKKAFQRFGIIKAGFLSIKRILKCHPLHPGGYDPIPEDE